METKKYTCDLCNKDYKSYKSMWHHKNKYHKNDIILPQKNSILSKDNSSLPQKNSNPDIISIQEKDTIIDEALICEYCKKIYSRLDNLNRHFTSCKMKKNIIKENEDLKKEVDEIKESFEKFKKQMLDIMNQKCKMHPKTFQKMINSNNNNNNNNITINNNNIKIIEFGREDLFNVFTKQEKIMLLKQLGSPIENIVRYTHLNDKFPQFQNIIITNIRSNQAYAYNEQLNKFILCDKNNLLEEMMIYRYDDLIGFFEQYSHLLSQKLKDTLQKSFLLKDDTTFCKNKYKEFNVIIYNECNKDNIKYKINENSSDDNIILE
jgi:hypothetical protein